MTFTRKGIEALHLNQLMHAQRQMDARHTKAKQNMTRKRWIERQKNANYRNEYDRIQGELSHLKTGDINKDKLLNRADELKRLFSAGNV